MKRQLSKSSGSPDRGGPTGFLPSDYIAPPPRYVSAREIVFERPIVWHALRRDLAEQEKESFEGPAFLFSFFLFLSAPAVIRSRVNSREKHGLETHADSLVYSKTIETARVNQRCTYRRIDVSRYR